MGSGGLFKQVRRQDRGTLRAPSAEARALWVKLMDARETSVRDFLESYDIPTKRVNSRTGKNLFPYRLREAQKRVLGEVEEFWGRGEGAKVLVLKDRQQGMSSFFESLMFERFARGGGGFGKTVSKDNDSSEELLRILVSFRLQTPDWVWADVLGGTWASERPDAMEFRRGAMISRLETMAAKDGAMGRGSSPRWMHISEYPWWSAGKGNLGAALDAWEDAPGNFVVIESTGRELDEFQQMCEAARDGKSPYKLLFFDWLSNPSKTYSFPSESARLELEGRVGREERYGKEEEKELLDRGATLGQIAWRRRKIDSPDVPGADLKYFAREHPLKFADAFYADSACVFQPMERLDERRKRLEVAEDKAARGTFEWADAKGTVVTWNPARFGPWTVYRQPENGRSYCWGADTASGARFVDRGRKEADWTVAEFREVESGEVVATFRDHVPPERFALEVMAASKWYGWARGYCERNNDGKVAIKELLDLQDAWLCPTDILLRQEKRIPTKSGEILEHFPGWHTDVMSKPLVINHLRRLTRALPEKVTEGEPFMLYLGLMEEMRRFVTRQMTGIDGRPRGRPRMEASEGHDDRVMASAMCLEAREWLKERPNEKTVMGRKKALTSAEHYASMIEGVFRPVRPEVACDPDLGRAF
jgi:hypothetical protein